MAHLHTLTGNWVSNDAHILGRWDCRSAQNRFGLLEDIVSGMQNSDGALQIFKDWNFGFEIIGFYLNWLIMCV
jgi:hypothetical protein